MLPCWDQGLSSSECLEQWCPHPSGPELSWLFFYMNELTFKYCFIVSSLHLIIYCVHPYLSTSINLMAERAVILFI